MPSSILRDRVTCYADVLWDCDYADPLRGAWKLSYWKQLLERERPDVVVGDFAHNALCVARRLGIPTVRIGTGYTCPPADIAERRFAGALPCTSQELHRRNAECLAHVDYALRAIGLPSVDSWAEFFHADATAITVCPELDHFPRAAPDEYVGLIHSQGGDPPEWPEAGDVSVYVYLRPFDGYERLLRYVRDVRFHAIVDGRDVPSDLQTELSGPTLRFANRRLEMSRIAHDARFAITNAGMGVVGHFLSRGKPLALLPRYQEQGILGERLAAAELCTLGYLEEFESQLSAIRAAALDPRYSIHAREFQKRHAEATSDHSIQRILSAIARISN
ncbi:MAG: hypothetical protein QM811_06020 [Pirellulales bacterium]